MKVNNKRGKNNLELIVKIEPKDCWGLDHTLAQIILPCLEMMRNEKQGAPSDMPSFLIFEAMDRDEQDSPEGKAIHEQGFAEWLAILDKMIFSFRCIMKDDGVSMFFGGDKHDSQGYKLYQDKISEGLHLFAEYYQALWT